MSPDYTSKHSIAPKCSQVAVHNTYRYLRTTFSAAGRLGRALAFLALWTTTTPRSFADGPLYSVTDLGTLAGGSSATAINNHGQVVGQNTLAGPTWHAFLYNQGTMTDLGTLGGPSSEAWAINDAGQVAGESDTTNGTTHAFLYSGGIMTDLGTLGGPNSYAYGIDTNGQVVGWSEITNNVNPNAYHAFLYQAGTMTDLGTLGGSLSRAFAINDLGQIAGSAANGSNYTHTVIFSGGSITDLGVELDINEGYGINNQGMVVGYLRSATQTYDAFLYSGGITTDLGIPGGSYSLAWSINNHGDAVGLANTASYPSGFAVIYSNGATRNLNDLTSGSGWTLRQARGINESGQIVGNGINPAGQGHAFLLTPIRQRFSLQIQFNSGLVISWSTNAVGCALYQNADLTSPNWVAVTNVPMATNGQYHVLIPDIPADQRFYRLNCQ